MLPLRVASYKDGKTRDGDAAGQRHFERRVRGECGGARGGRKASGGGCRVAGRHGAICGQRHGRAAPRVVCAESETGVATGGGGGGEREGGAGVVGVVGVVEAAGVRGGGAVV